jgi:hypothetical protein
MLSDQSVQLNRAAKSVQLISLDVSTAYLLHAWLTDSSEEKGKPSD